MIFQQYGLLPWRGDKQLGGAKALETRGTVLPLVGVRYGTAKGDRHDLVPVAESKNRKAEFKDSRVDARCVFGIHAGRTTREDQSLWRHLCKLGGRDVAGHDL